MDALDRLTRDGRSRSSSPSRMNSREGHWDDNRTRFAGRDYMHGEGHFGEIDKHDMRKDREGRWGDDVLNNYMKKDEEGHCGTCGGIRGYDKEGRWDQEKWDRYNAIRHGSEGGHHWDGYYSRNRRYSRDMSDDEGTGYLGHGVSYLGQGSGYLGQGSGYLGRGSGYLGSGSSYLGQGHGERYRDRRFLRNDEGSGYLGQGHGEKYRNRRYSRDNLDDDEGTGYLGQGAGYLGQGAGYLGQGAGYLGQGAGYLGQGAGYLGQGHGERYLHRRHSRDNLDDEGGRHSDGSPTRYNMIRK